MERLEDTAPTSASAWVDDALAERARAIQTRIAAAARRADRTAESVTLIAVTKTVPAERVLAAAALGLTVFGENRVQEARDKRVRLAALAEGDPNAARLLGRMRWELIGHLQTNKSGRALELFDRIQSVDSLRLAEALSARATVLNRTLPILLEVNVAGEGSKSGFAADEAENVARVIAALPMLRIEGLMTVAPLVPDPEQARPVFRRLRELHDHLRAAVPLGEEGWRELSMGMSDDFEVAIEEGATLVRIGRGLFGERPAPQMTTNPPLN
ncbi:MAG TPA: YggS family pyridoxal phosphate-dependent enzyme [Ktedonobacterales bacterium]|nr:YggS family pyridoxal phosphate-dependent enzyme [Ktedonobacterales bacterium]